MEPETLGMKRVRLSFNPSGDKSVNEIKKMAADFIDYLEPIRRKSGGDAEINRLISLAQTHIEDAAMWAVKAATA